MRTTTQPECPCAPCIERERALCEHFIIEHTPIADKVGKRYADEFRRLLSIAAQYTFAERMAQLEAFSAGTAEEQWTMLRRLAEGQKEGVIDDCNAAFDEGNDLDAIIAEATRHLMPDDPAQAGTAHGVTRD